MPEISDAAVEAAYNAMEFGRDPFTTDPTYGSPDQIREAIRDGLAAALPFLGEQGTEYGYRWSHPDGSRPVARVDFLVEIPPGEPVMWRPVIYGEWTEVPT